jgi:hypothetical protein
MLAPCALLQSAPSPPPPRPHTHPAPTPQSARALLKKFGFRLHELVDAKAMAARYLPHLPWKANP